MGLVSRAVVAAAAALAIVNAPAQPEFILGIEDGAYGAFTPQAVVEAGRGGTGVPTPPDDTTRRALEATGTTVQWTPLNTLLEEELYDEFSGGTLPAPLDVLLVDSVDNTGRRLTLGAKPFSNVAPKAPGTAAAGIAINPSRGDHVHPAQAVPAPSTVTPKVEGTAAIGTDAGFSRGDHVHPAGGGSVTYSLTAQNVGTASAPGTATAVSRGDHVHGRGAGRFVSDPGAQGVNNGDVLTRTGSNSYGWAAPSGGGVTYSTSATALASASAPGSASTVSRGDHAHGGGPVPAASTTTPKVEGTAAVGTETAWARGDHVHPADGGGGGPALSDDDPEAVGPESVHGSSAKASRGDHLHAYGFSNPAILPGDDGGLVAFAGTKNWPARADHAHKTIVPSASGKLGQVMRVNATNPTLEWDTPHNVVLAGLPAITGQGGNYLRINTGATGLEWSEVAGPGGGGATWTTIFKILVNPTAEIPAGGRLSNIQFGTSASVTAYRTKMQSDAPYRTCAVRTRWSISDSVLAGAPLQLFFPTGANGIFAYLLRPEGTSGIINFFIHQTGTSPNEKWTLDIANATSLSLETSYSFGLNLLCTEALLGAGGSGGGNTGPSIPAPTAAGALQHLRVNAAGAAYELATPYSTSKPLASVEGGATGAQTTLSRSDHRHPGDLPTCTDCEHDVLVVTDDGGTNWSPRLSAIDRPSFDETAVNHKGQLLAIEQCGDQGQEIVCSVGYQAVNETQWDKIDERSVSIGGTVSYTIAARAVNDVFAVMQSSASTAFHAFVLYGTWQSASSGNGSFVSTARWELAGLPPGHVIPAEYEEYRTWGVTRTKGADSHVAMVVNDQGTITITIDGLNSEGVGTGTFALYGLR